MHFFSSGNQEQQHSLHTRQTARKIWILLTSRYQQNSTERKLYLVQQFLNYKLKPELSIRAHIESIKLIAQKIRAAGIAMDDEKSVERFSPLFQEVRCSCESCPIADRTLENLTSRVVREEERLNLINGGHSSADQAFFGEHET
jgi:hypothetical protein